MICNRILHIRKKSLRPTMFRLSQMSVLKSTPPPGSVPNEASSSACDRVLMYSVLKMASTGGC